MYYKYLNSKYYIFCQYIYIYFCHQTFILHLKSFIHKQNLSILEKDIKYKLATLRKTSF